MSITDDMLAYAEHMKCKELHMCVDVETGLKAIVAIHNTNLGPALGGCRWLEYNSTQDAVVDAIRLAQGMSYKSALSGLPLGGGKTVVMKPKTPVDEQAYFKALGRFIDHLGGRYITAVDSGTNSSHMDIILTETKHVTSHNQGVYSHSDPSPMTAFGVYRGVQAVVQYGMGRQDLEGVHVVIQGLGHVGYHLAGHLHRAGAKLSVFDINKEVERQAVEEFGATAIPSAEDVFEIPCDVFAPCALGAVLSEKTIPKLNCKMIAGAANNQLARSADAKRLLDRNILYAPDFVVNAGGIIYVAGEYYRHPESLTTDKISQIYDTLMEIFQRASRENQSTYQIAHDIALERINGEK